MIKRAIGYLAFFTGSFAAMISSILLILTIIVPFVGESFSGSRGATALVIMETGGITLEYYSNTIATLTLLLALGVVTASVGRYIVDLTED